MYFLERIIYDCKLMWDYIKKKQVANNIAKH